MSLDCNSQEVDGGIVFKEDIICFDNLQRLVKVKEVIDVSMSRSNEYQSSNALYSRGRGPTGIALDNGGIQATKAAKGR